MAKTTVERRAHARFPKSFEIQGRPGDGEAAATMIASDLSLGGLYCTSTIRFPEMSRLCVRLMLPDSDDGNGAHPLDVEAVVVREHKLGSSTGNSRYELALFFTHMTDEQRKRLARYLAQP